MKKPRVVIIGGGFGGLTATKALKNADVEIILIDKTNHHLFQPLLYQVATAALSPGDIALPLREILRLQNNVKVILGEITAIDRFNKKVILEDEEIKFDYLIVATGSRHFYFGKNDWEENAPGLKTVSDALRIRERILNSFEIAERILFEASLNSHIADVKKYLTFVLVGAGPTGVELAGAIAEISRKTMLKDFRFIKPEKTSVILVEGLDRVLPMYDRDLSEKAKESLERIGVTVLLNTQVTAVTKNGVYLGDDFIETNNVIWAAGNTALSLQKTLETELDRAGRVVVNKDLSIKENPKIFVIGDAALSLDEKGKPLPGVCPVAIQQGKYVANTINRDIKGKPRVDFRYFDKGSMATIGRAKGIAEIAGLKLSGYIAWLAWSFIHILYLIGFRNRYRVMIEWIWIYFTRRNGIRLITNKPEGILSEEQKLKV